MSIGTAVVLHDVSRTQQGPYYGGCVTQAARMLWAGHGSWQGGVPHQDEELLSRQADAVLDLVALL